MPVHQTSFQPTWTTERVELLKRAFAAGLSCRQIAAQIGVSRNAVIGKISRLKLTRDKGEMVRTAKRGTTSERRPRAASKLRQILVKAVPEEPPVGIENDAIHNGHTCSLQELTAQTCRWPISTPGLADFCFCGNLPLDGLPYCRGHSRLAYRLSSQR